MTGSDVTQGSVIYGEEELAAASVSRFKDCETQTETVFGLEDLPTITKIIRNTIAKTRQHEQEVKPTSEVSSGPVNGIYTCNICAKVRLCYVLVYFTSLK